MSDMSLWLASLIFIKVILYLSISMTLGGLFLLSQNYGSTRWTQLLYRYVLWGSVLGVIAGISQFFLQVGQFSDSGFSGMWDSTMMTILWNSSVGSRLQIYVVTWFVISIPLLVFNQKPSRFYWVLLIIALVLPSSFALAGHVADKNIEIKIILYLHAVIALGWMGSLFPLWKSGDALPIAMLQRLMHSFGVVAAVLVPVLLIAGGFIAYQLVGSLENLLHSSHGQWLLFKVLLVTVLLSLAALHKFRLVPQLQSSHNVKRLQRSISIEMIVGLLVLSSTSLLSTAFAPVSMV